MARSLRKSVLSGPSITFAGGASPLAGGPAALPVTESRQGQPVAYLAGKTVKLRSAAVGHVLFRVEQADPQTGRPGVLDLLLGPLPPGRPAACW
jgi:hypothetical protein